MRFPYIKTKRSTLDMHAGIKDEEWCSSSFPITDDEATFPSPPRSAPLPKRSLDARIPSTFSVPNSPSSPRTPRPKRSFDIRPLQFTSRRTVTPEPSKSTDVPHSPLKALPPTPMPETSIMPERSSTPTITVSAPKSFDLERSFRPLSPPLTRPVRFQLPSRSPSCPTPNRLSVLDALDRDKRGFGRQSSLSVNSPSPYKDAKKEKKQQRRKALTSFLDFGSDAEMSDGEQGEWSVSRGAVCILPKVDHTNAFDDEDLPLEYSFEEIGHEESAGESSSCPDTESDEGLVLALNEEEAPIPSPTLSSSSKQHIFDDDELAMDFLSPTLDSFPTPPLSSCGSSTNSSVTSCDSRRGLFIKSSFERVRAIADSICSSDEEGDDELGPLREQFFSSKRIATPPPLTRGFVVSMDMEF